MARKKSEVSPARGAIRTRKSEPPRRARARVRDRDESIDTATRARSTRPSGDDDDARRRLDLDERREQLVALGKRLFSERAYDEISIEDIADAAGISKGLLYHYFGSKRGFYVAVVREAAGQLVAATDVGAHVPAAERARLGLEGYLDFAEAHSAAFVTLLRGGIGNDSEVAEIVDGTREAIVERILTNMGQTQPRPVFRLAIRSFVGLVEAATIDWLERRAVDRATLLRFLIASIQSVVSTALLLDSEASSATS